MVTVTVCCNRDFIPLEYLRLGCKAAGYFMSDFRRDIFAHGKRLYEVIVLPAVILPEDLLGRNEFRIGTLRNTVYTGHIFFPVRIDSLFI